MQTELTPYPEFGMGWAAAWDALNIPGAANPVSAPLPSIVRAPIEVPVAGYTDIAVESSAYGYPYAEFADFAAPYGAYDYGLETALPVAADFAAPYGYPAFEAPVYASEAPFYPAFDAVAAPAIEPAYVAPFYEAPVEEVFTAPVAPMDLSLIHI